jgi:outer membrane protein assembly factor BamB
MRRLGSSIVLGVALLAWFSAAPASGPASASAPSATDGNWPQWRGPDGLGISAETGFATEWSPTKNIKWKTAIPGRGHSSPVIWGDHIFLTTSFKEEPVPGGRKAPVHLDFSYRPGYVHPDAVDIEFIHKLDTLAVDAKTGKILWEKTSYEGLMADDHHRSNTYASPSVVTDGTLAYAFFESLGLYAYDFDGNLKWKTSLGDIIKAGLGPGTSPVLYKNLIILQCDQEMGTGSFIVALDKRTGKEVWRTERKNRRSWATPLLVKAGDRFELIASGAESDASYDPDGGKELWHANGTESHPIPSSVAGHGLVILTAGSQAKRALAIKLGATGDLTNSSSVVWRYAKGTAYVASPILVGQYLYLESDGGIVTCLDVDTGAVVYEGGRPPVPAEIRASFVSFEDKLLMTSDDGNTYVIKAGPKFELLATNTVDEPVWASPALSRGTIYIRGDQHLFAIATVK